MKHSFFSIYGNNIPFNSLSKLVLLIIGLLGIFLALAMWFFKNLIYRSYQNKIIKISNVNLTLFWRLFGLITLLGVILRSVLLVLVKYPFLWEIFPLHLCRLILVFCAFSMLINKNHWIRYFGPIGILGATTALLLPEMHNNNIGLDSYYYWDYIFTHWYVLLIPTFLLIINVKNYQFKDTFITLTLFFFLALLMFLINFITNTNKHIPIEWKSNYFYLGKNEFNTLKDFIKPLSFWPFNLFTFMFCILLYMVLFIAIWLLQSHIYIDLINKKIIIKWISNTNWKLYKNSIKNFLLHRNNL
ncbi:YwaF family protein [Mycoplasma sp. 744]|nr:YwaF family protein [Mycoplasma sp. 744]